MLLSDHSFGPELRRLDSLTSIHVTLDLPLCARALELYLSEDPYSPSETADALGVSERKLRAVREWLILLGLLETVGGRSVPTTDARLFQQISESDPEAFLALTYYRLCTRNQLVAGLVNVFMAGQLAYSLAPSFDRSEAQAWFLNFFQEVRSENDLRECFTRFFSPFVRSDGFGPLGLLDEGGDGKRLEIRAYEPDSLVLAYILADRANGRASIPVDEALSGFNSPGRLLFMTRPALMARLVLLEQQGLCQIDQTAGLNQIALGGLNPRSVLTELAR